MKALFKKLSIVIYVLAWILVGKIAQASPIITEQSSKVTAQEMELYDKKRNRPVKVMVWYQPGDDCNNAKICLADTINTQQVAILSHGAMGSALNYNWIGQSLA